MADPQRYSVVVIGAGMSGVCMGIKLRQRGIEDFLILEQSACVGGTWFDNTYPGAACDVPSVLYSYSFEPNPNWSRKYSPQNEIQAYFAHCVQKYNLAPRLRLNTAVVSARYDDANGDWQLQLENGDRLHTRALVSGLGQLNKPHIPALAGAEQFSGVQFHSARWNHEVDLAGKRVAVIGNAASALQFIPSVADQASKLFVYQRSANYVIKRHDRAYTTDEQRRFKRMPWLQKLHRLGFYLRGEVLLYPVLRKNSVLAPRVRKWCRQHLEEHVHDPDLRRQLTPDYPVGCKRILVSDDYYQALARPDVELVTAPVVGMDAQGIRSADEIRRDVDVVIYGTGFQTTNMLSGVEFTGARGMGLRQAWADGAEAYRGVCVAGFPNFFMLYGPNTNLGSNSIIFMVERQVNYALNCIEKLLDHKLRSLEVNPSAMRAYNDRLQGEMGGTVWLASCESWYKNAAGKVVNNWPRSTLAYWWAMRGPDFADFDMHS